MLLVSLASPAVLLFAVHLTKVTKESRPPGHPLLCHQLMLLMSSAFPDAHLSHDNPLKVSKKSLLPGRGKKGFACCA